MALLIPYKFELNGVFEEDLSRPLQEYYLELSKKIFAADFTFPSGVELLTIPFSEDGSEFRGGSLSELFAEKLRTDLDTDSIAGEEVMILIDWSDVNTGSKALYPLITRVIIPLLDAIKALELARTTPAVFLIVESLSSRRDTFAEGDAAADYYYSSDWFYNLLDDQYRIDEGIVCVLGVNDNSGCYSWKHKKFEEVEKFYSLLKPLKPDPYEMMKYKLIKRIGNFERNSSRQSKACQQYFYYGDFCENEITQLITERILDLFIRKIINPRYIVFHCDLSPWLRRAIIRTTGKLISLKQNSFKGKYSSLEIEKCLSADALRNGDGSVDEGVQASNAGESPASGAESMGDVLFIVDFVHTGSELTTMLDETVRPSFPASGIRALTLLCTTDAVSRLAIPDKDLCLAMEFGPQPETIEVDYIHEVEHKVYVEGINDCPMCRFDLLPRVSVNSEVEPENGSDREVKKEDSFVRSYEMWLMANKSKYCREQVLPSPRNPEFLPNAIQMVKKYGPYLAYKINKSLKTHLKTLNPDKPVIILYPDERTNSRFKLKRGRKSIKLADTPSGFLVTCLSQMLDFKLFGVPREVLDALKPHGGKPAIELGDLSKEFPDFSRQMRQLPRENLVIVDESFVTGGTVKSMLSILGEYNRYPDCYFPLFVFGSQTLSSKKSSGEFQSIQVMTLYELQLAGIPKG